MRFYTDFCPIVLFLTNIGAWVLFLDFFYTFSWTLTNRVIVPNPAIFPITGESRSSFNLPLEINDKKKPLIILLWFWEFYINCCDTHRLITLFSSFGMKKVELLLLRIRPETEVSTDLPKNDVVNEDSHDMDDEILFR